MRIKGLLFSLALAVAAPAMAQNAPVATLSGNYVEFRNADVYTGPCFANSEMGLTGQEAVLGWQVEQGSWAGVPLDGLAVVAVVRASATLGDPFENPLPAKTVLIVDERASEVQRAALLQFAQAQTAGLLDNVVAVQAAPIAFSMGAGEHGGASLQAGNLLRLATRPIGSGDEICHNEQIYYQPLAMHLSHAMPAVALDSTYAGNHLGISWSESGRRGAFVGSFAF